MTNAEKFKEVFGFPVEPDRFSLCVMIPECCKCPFWTCRHCGSEAKGFWNREYGEFGHENHSSI